MKYELKLLYFEVRALAGKLPANLNLRYDLIPVLAKTPQLMDYIISASVVYQGLFPKINAGFFKIGDQNQTETGANLCYC